MQEVRLTIKKRAFPSKGRVRLNVAQLADLEVLEGEHVDLVNESTKKTVTATVIADTMVPAGQVRVSEEDLKTIGLQDKDEVLVKKTSPLMDKIKKTGADVKTGAVKAGSDVKAGAVKAGSDVKAGAVKAGSDVKAGAVKLGSDVKKKITKPDKDL